MGEGDTVRCQHLSQGDTQRCQRLYLPTYVRSYAGPACAGRFRNGGGNGGGGSGGGGPAAMMGEPPMGREGRGIGPRHTYKDKLLGTDRQPTHRERVT